MLVIWYLVDEWWCKAAMRPSPRVRKTPCRPTSWANTSLLSLYSHRNAWANSHLLRQPNALLG
jgi:hypothetical protein